MRRMGARLGVGAVAARARMGHADFTAAADALATRRSGRKLMVRTRATCPPEGRTRRPHTLPESPPQQGEDTVSGGEPAWGCRRSLGHGTGWRVTQGGVGGNTPIHPKAEDVLPTSLPRAPPSVRRKTETVAKSPL